MYKISTTPASTDVIVFRLEIESRLVLLNNKFIFEAYFSLFISITLSLPTRTYRFDSNFIFSTLLFLIAFHFIHLLLYQLHRFVLIMLWSGFLMMMVSFLFMKCNASTEFIQHIKLYIFQMILLEIVIFECLHTNATFQLFDWFCITKEIWYFIYPLRLLDLFVFCRLLRLGIASTVYSHHLIAWWHIFISLIIKVVVIDWTLIVFTVWSEVFHLHTFVGWSLTIIVHLTWVSYLFSTRAVVWTAKNYILRWRRSLSWLVLVRLRSRNFSLLDIGGVLFLTDCWILESFLVQTINTF